MLLGKRPRAPIMKRTTSMTEITLDLNTSTTDSRPSDPHNLFDARQKPAVTGALSGQHSHGAGHNWLDQRFSPRTNRRHSADFLETPNFLRACSLCKRRLVPGRDIYMYSLECRQQQMNQDERKEKCGLASKKEGGGSSGTGAAANGETVAAV
ncbi:uncharacterized protein LOC110813281 isoform X2 [Carica papaya]|uniref:uncharacterized protein LOC110813281 isoform X2 n=1 Tax=Carica papaya TaxID=3649 RepID=UPI000B8CBA1C|nr:uncharacterized protein LOC110813281 isoform X2 [Carica papaya]